MLRAVTLFVNVAVAFYMMPFIIHAIGDRWHGMWTLAATFIVGAALQTVAWLIVDRVAITGYIHVLLLLPAIYPVLLLVMMHMMFSSRELRLIRETGQRALGMA